jgi:hypothetical protein
MCRGREREISVTDLTISSLGSFAWELLSAHFVGDRFDVHYLDGSKPMGVSGSLLAATSASLQRTRQRSKALRLAGTRMELKHGACAE